MFHAISRYGCDKAGRCYEEHLMGFSSTSGRACHITNFKKTVCFLTSRGKVTKCEVYDRVCALTLHFTLLPLLRRSDGVARYLLALATRPGSGGFGSSSAALQNCH